MDVKDLNIEGLTEKEFHAKVSRMMDKVYEFALRGREELGYDIAYINVFGIHEKETDGVFASDMSFGSSDMFLSLAMQIDTLERVIELNKKNEMSEFLGEFFGMEGEEDE